MHSTERAADELDRVMPSVYNLGIKAGHWLADLIYAEQRPRITVTDVITGVQSFPVWYKEWWLNLVANDPIHVLVETLMVIAILYFLVSRSKDWKANEARDKLTVKEENELLHDWKKNIRAPLAPPLPTTKHARNGPTPYNPDALVVHKVDGRVMTMQSSSPSSGSSCSDSTPITNNTTINSLHSPNSASSSSSASSASSSSSCPDPATVQYWSVLNFGTADYLGRSSANSPIKEAALRALDKYGCGSCGPRGFYGTIDVHLQLERVFSEFLGTDDAILYSDGASTVSSTVAAFAKRGDLIVVDEAIYEPLMTGLTLSRANVKWFKHNDMTDLRQLLEQVRDTDKKLGRKINEQRRFLVVEGLYKNTGQIVPLDVLVALKEEFLYRLILDESNSFGVLGATGRGVSELYGKKLMRDVEITTISLENAVGSIGGITVGSEEVVDHQRLNGSGYCFSASSPPFTATAAIKSLELLQSQPDTLKQLRSNIKYFYAKLVNLCQQQLEEVLVVTSDERSPMVMLQVAKIPETKNLDEAALLGEVVRESLRRGVAFVAATGQAQAAVVMAELSPAIRICVSAAHTKDDLDQAIRVLGESVDVVLTRFHEAVAEGQ